MCVCVCVCSLSSSIINYACPNFLATCAVALMFTLQFELSKIPSIPSNGHVGVLWQFFFYYNSPKLLSCYLYHHNPLKFSSIGRHTPTPKQETSRMCSKRSPKVIWIGVHIVVQTRINLCSRCVFAVMLRLSCFFCQHKFMTIDDNVIFHDADVCFLNSIVVRLW